MSVKRAAIGLVVAWQVFAGAASAAPFFLQGLVTGESDVLAVGTLMVANHVGDVAAPMTVNGVNFGIDASMLSGMLVGGGDYSTQFTSGSPLDQLFSGIYYQPGGTSSLTLTGLTVGQDYLLQLFFGNGGGNTTGWQSRVTAQGNAFNMANFGGSAQFLRVGFEAASETEVIAFGTGGTAEMERMVLSGYALATDEGPAPVPEPASLALVTVGLAGAAWLRRRKR